MGWRTIIQLQPTNMPVITSRSIETTPTGEPKMAYMYQMYAWGSAANTFVVTDGNAFSYSLTSSQYILLPKNVSSLVGWKWGSSSSAGADFQVGFYSAETMYGTQTDLGIQATITNGTLFYEGNNVISLETNVNYICPYFYVPSGVVSGPWKFAIFFQ